MRTHELRCRSARPNAVPHTRSTATAAPRPLFEHLVGYAHHRFAAPQARGVGAFAQWKARRTPARTLSPCVRLAASVACLGCTLPARAVRLLHTPEQSRRGCSCMVRADAWRAVLTAARVCGARPRRGSVHQYSRTRILGRHTAPFHRSLFPNRVLHGFLGNIGGVEGRQHSEGPRPEGSGSVQR